MTYKGDNQDFDFIDGDNDREELEKVNTKAAEIHKVTGLEGEALLLQAIGESGYDLGQSRLEICVACDQLYHRDYMGEYIDPNDKDDIEEELGYKIPSQYHYNHYCGFECLMYHVREG